MGIKPNRWFVENDQIRLVHQGVGEANPLLIALGKLADDLPADLIAREREGGAHVLAHGEATGHRHAIYDDGAELLEPKPAAPDAVERRDGNVLYLRVTQPVALRHEEHAAIGLAPGNYRVTRQREYSPEEIRTVAD